MHAFGDDAQHRHCVMKIRLTALITALIAAQLLKEAGKH